jgi:hypothetical protein
MDEIEAVMDDNREGLLDTASRDLRGIREAAVPDDGDRDGGLDSDTV